MGEKPSQIITELAGVMGSSSEPSPVLLTTEVRTAPEYLQARELDKIVFTIKAREEQALAILDQVNEYIDPDVLRQSGLLDDLRVDAGLLKEVEDLESGDLDKLFNEIDSNLKRFYSETGEDQYHSDFEYFNLAFDEAENEAELSLNLEQIGWTEEKVKAFLKAKISRQRAIDQLSSGRMGAKLEYLKKVYIAKNGEKPDSGTVFDETIAHLRIKKRLDEGLGLSLDDLMVFRSLADKSAAEYDRIVSFDEMLFDSIKAIVSREAESGQLIGDDRSNRERDEFVEDMSEGIWDRLTKRLDTDISIQYSPIHRLLKRGDVQDVLAAYRKNIYQKAREMIDRIKPADRATDTAFASKSGEIYHTTAEVAAIRLNTSDLEIVNTLEALRSGRKKIVKEKTGKDSVIGMNEVNDEIAELKESEFISAYVYYGREMRNLYRMLESGTIVEVDYIKNIIDKAYAILTKNPPGVVWFRGDFGTGKTATARHICLTRFHKEPIFVGGNKFIEPRDLTEKTEISRLSHEELLERLGEALDSETSDEEKESLVAQITRSVVQEGDLEQAVAHSILNFRNTSGGDEGGSEYSAETDYMSELSDEDKRRCKKYTTQFFENPVQSRYVMRYIYEAWSTGTPLIIDEGNAIPEEVWIAIYDVFSKKVGEKVRAKSSPTGEIEVRKGFCMMITGNVGRKYTAARVDFSPALNSRIFPIEVRYLPQQYEFGQIEEIAKRLNLTDIKEEVLADDESIKKLFADSKERAARDQIFQVLLVSMLNRRLGMEVIAKKDKDGNIDRYSSVKDLYRLSVGARLAMNIFEGANISDDFVASLGLREYFDTFTTSSIRDKLNNSNLSMRELMENIGNQFKDYNGSLDIEWFLFQYINARNIEEKVILYAIMRKVEFFDPAEGWPDLESPEFKSGKASENLAKVRTFLDQFDPASSVTKYERHRNGNTVNMLSASQTTDDGEKRFPYVSQYITSTEVMQLMFGYLPPKKREDFESVSLSLRNLENSESRDQTASEKFQEVRLYLKEKLLIKKPEGLSIEDHKKAVFDLYQGKPAHATMVKEYLLNHELSNRIEEMTDDQILENLENFIKDFTIEVLVKIGLVTEEQASYVASAQGAQASADALKYVLK